MKSAATNENAIAELAPGAQWAMSNDDLATLQWFDTVIPRPTDEAITAQRNSMNKTMPSSADFIGRFTNAEYRAATATTWRQTAGNAKNWDVVVFDPIVNLNKKKAATLKTSLVTDGILTQVRADEIFS